MLLLLLIVKERHDNWQADFSGIVSHRLFCASLCLCCFSLSDQSMFLSRICYASGRFKILKTLCSLRA